MILEAKKGCPVTLYIFLVIFLLSFVSQGNLYAQGTIKIIGYNVLDGMSKDTTPGKIEFATWLKAQD
ncbi:MAG: hypothetical protein ACREFE_15490, partial [Limisphaerales bacterium]